MHPFYQFCIGKICKLVSSERVKLSFSANVANFFTLITLTDFYTKFMGSKWSVHFSGSVIQKEYMFSKSSQTTGVTVVDFFCFTTMYVIYRVCVYWYIHTAQEQDRGQDGDRELDQWTLIYYTKIFILVRDRERDQDPWFLWCQFCSLYCPRSCSRAVRINHKSRLYGIYGLMESI